MMACSAPMETEGREGIYASSMLSQRDQPLTQSPKTPFALQADEECDSFFLEEFFGLEEWGDVQRDNDDWVHTIIKETLTPTKRIKISHEPSQATGEAQPPSSFESSTGSLRTLNLGTLAPPRTVSPPPDINGSVEPSSIPPRTPQPAGNTTKESDIQRPASLPPVANETTKGATPTRRISDDHGDEYDFGDELETELKRVLEEEARGDTSQSLSCVSTPDGSQETITISDDEDVEDAEWEAELEAELEAQRQENSTRQDRQPSRKRKQLDDDASTVWMASRLSVPTPRNIARPKPPKQIRNKRPKPTDPLALDNEERMAVCLMITGKNPEYAVKQVARDHNVDFQRLYHLTKVASARDPLSLGDEERMAMCLMKVAEDPSVVKKQVAQDHNVRANKLCALNRIASPFAKAYEPSSIMPAESPFTSHTPSPQQTPQPAMLPFPSAPQTHAYPGSSTVRGPAGYPGYPVSRAPTFMVTQALYQQGPVGKFLQTTPNPPPAISSYNSDSMHLDGGDDLFGEGPGNNLFGEDTLMSGFGPELGSVEQALPATANSPGFGKSHISLDQLRLEVKQQLRVEVEAKIRYELERDFRGKLRNQLRHEIKEELRMELSEEFKAEVRTELLTKGLSEAERLAKCLFIVSENPNVIKTTLARDYDVSYSKLMKYIANRPPSGQFVRVLKEQPTYMAPPHFQQTLATGHYSPSPTVMMPSLLSNHDVPFQLFEGGLPSRALHQRSESRNISSSGPSTSIHIDLTREAAPQQTRAPVDYDHILEVLRSLLTAAAGNTQSEDMSRLFDSLETKYHQDPKFKLSLIKWGITKLEVLRQLQAHSGHLSKSPGNPVAGVGGQNSHAVGNVVSNENSGLISCPT